MYNLEDIIVSGVLVLVCDYYDPSTGQYDWDRPFMMRCGGCCWGVIRDGYGVWEVPVGVGMFCMYRTRGGIGAKWYIGAYSEINRIYTLFK